MHACMRACVRVSVWRVLRVVCCACERKRVQREQRGLCLLRVMFFSLVYSAPACACMGGRVFGGHQDTHLLTHTSTHAHTYTLAYAQGCRDLRRQAHWSSCLWPLLVDVFLMDVDQEDAAPPAHAANGGSSNQGQQQQEQYSRAAATSPSSPSASSSSASSSSSSLPAAARRHEQMTRLFGYTMNVFALVHFNALVECNRPAGASGSNYAAAASSSSSSSLRDGVAADGLGHAEEGAGGVGGGGAGGGGGRKGGGGDRNGKAGRGAETLGDGEFEKCISDTLSFLFYFGGERRTKIGKFICACRHVCMHMQACMHARSVFIVMGRRAHAEVTHAGDGSH
jgi:hypothetical protein